MRHWAVWVMAVVLLGTGLFFIQHSVTDAKQISSEVLNWNFKPAKDQQPADADPHYKELLKEYDGVFMGCPQDKSLYLTFDNGYENGYTKQVLDVLKEKEVPAAFFITGHYLTTETDLINRMIKEGHIVGNHSYHHPSLPEVSEERVKRELTKLKEEYKEITGEEYMPYLRPPQGKFSEESLSLSRDLGYINVFWSLAYKDWETDNQKGADYAYEQIMNRIHPGSIMLLHSVSKDNAEALGRVIDECRKQGYEFKSLDDLMMKKTMRKFHP
ncbi:delta-lactam-biosynthetic de-N-acetylase [Thalassorhabdus alkalitolerans]|uniref:Delta-lactam-biosynthetic de-N-acetylase n=1 Tax=Thalassorhabdus alkalitolerans TaxID=2282697 RepID=A0ABW0YP76_9BACI